MIQRSPIWSEFLSGHRTPHLFGLEWRPTSKASTGRIVNEGSGDLIDHLPIEAPARSTSGFLQTSFLEYFYYRIHLLPAQINVGNLLSSQVRAFSIWNANFDEQSFDAISASNNDGVVLSNTNTPSVVPPESIKPLQLVNYSVSVSQDGPSSISTVYDFLIAGQSYRVSVVGSRVVVFPFLHDWKNPLGNTLEFKTDIIKKLDGSEQRRGLRDTPRRKLRYDVLLLDRKETQYLQSLLFGWSGRSFAVPNPQDVVDLSSTVFVDDTVLLIDNASDYAFAPGHLLMIYKDYKNFESQEIALVSQNSITLKQGVLSDWQAGTSVVPVFIGHLARGVAFDAITNHYASMRVSFLMDPAGDNVFLPDLDPPTEFEGIELYEENPNWSSSPTFSFNSDYYEFDPVVTGKYYEDRSGFPDSIVRHNWLFLSRQEIVAFKAFERRRDGRRVPVLIPSWMEDFTLSENISSAGTVIIVEDNGYRQLVNNHPARSHIYIRLKNGAGYPCKVVGVNAGASDTLQLSISAAIGVTIQIQDVEQICYLYKARMATDNITEQWITGSCMSVTASFLAVIE